jgi:hypothetical protein
MKPLIRTQFLMDEDSIRFHRLRGIKHRRQLLIIDLDKREGLLHDVHLLSNDRSYFLSHKAYLTLGQDRDVLKAQPHTNRRQILPCEHCKDSLYLFCLGAIHL